MIGRVEGSTYTDKPLAFLPEDAIEQQPPYISDYF